MKFLAIAMARLSAAALAGFCYLKYRMAHTTDRKNLQAAVEEESSKFVRPAKVPGPVVGVYKEGRSFIKGYGDGSGDARGAPGAKTVFQIASVGKVFTASLLQMLCDEGVVRMDATLGELLGNSTWLSPAARQVTLRQLATHTSGFPSIPRLLRIQAAEAAKGEDPMLEPLHPPFTKMREPQFQGETGIGWMQPGFMERFFGNEHVVWHNGMVGGYASYLSIDSQAGTGVVMLVNKALPVDMLGMMLMRQARTQSWAGGV